MPGAWWGAMNESKRWHWRPLAQLAPTVIGAAEGTLLLPTAVATVGSGDSWQPPAGASAAAFDENWPLIGAEQCHQFRILVRSVTCASNAFVSARIRSLAR